MNPLAPLRDRDFRLYFAGEVISFLGSGLSLVAVNWYLLARTGSATAVGAAWAVALGAGVLAFPLAGAIADRYSRRLIAVAADLLRLAAVSVLATLAFLGDPPLWTIYATMFVVGLGYAVFFPAIYAFLQEIVHPAQLMAASGLAEVTAQAGSLSGAALAGPVLTRFGLGWAFVIDGGTYLISAGALTAVRHRSSVGAAGAPYLQLLREGWSYLRRNLPVAAFGVVSIVPGVATVVSNVVLVSYVMDVMHRDATAYGIADMTYGAGALLSGFAAALVVVRLGEWSALTCFMLAVIGSYATLSLGPTGLPAVLGLVFTAGFCSSAFRVTANAVLLRVVPNEVMGRTGASIGLSSTLIQVSLALAVGPVINRGGAEAGYAMLALLVAGGVAALVAALPALRRSAEVA